MQVDLTAIHNLMTKYYGSRTLALYTNVEEKSFIKPYSLKLIFDYDPTIEIDYIILLRKLREYINEGQIQFNLNVVKEENRIYIYVIMYKKSEYNDYFFEFSEN
jgi:hypothetical protein